MKRSLNKKLNIFTDGACSGNPGEAGIAFLIKEENKTIVEFSQNIGVATNNIAEYMAVIYALQEALKLKVERIAVYSDSELLVNQVKGTYKVKNANIKPLFEQVKHLSEGFAEVIFQHIPRGENNDADCLAKKAIQKEQTKVVASGAFASGEESPSSKG